jgi:hypothetical protein
MALKPRSVAGTRVHVYYGPVAGEPGGGKPGGVKPELAVSSLVTASGANDAVGITTPSPTAPLRIGGRCRRGQESAR